MTPVVIPFLSSHLPGLRAFLICLWKQFRLPGSLDVHALKGDKGRLYDYPKPAGPVDLVSTKRFSSDSRWFRKDGRRSVSAFKLALINRINRKMPESYFNLISGLWTNMSLSQWMAEVSIIKPMPSLQPFKLLDRTKLGTYGHRILFHSCLVRSQNVFSIRELLHIFVEIFSSSIIAS